MLYHQPNSSHPASCEGCTTDSRKWGRTIPDTQDMDRCSRLSGAIFDASGVNIEPQEVSSIVRFLAMNDHAQKDLDALVHQVQKEWRASLLKDAEQVTSLIDEDADDVLRFAFGLAEHSTSFAAFNSLVIRIRDRK